MPSQPILFSGSQGAWLAARLDTPDKSPKAWAVFAHCFTCSKDSKAAAYIARALAEAGYGVLRFDFTGLGGSGGDFASTHFSSNVDDLIAAADWLREHHGPPALLVGHSLGGAAVLAAAGRIEGCEAVATLGAPFQPSHVTRHFGDGLQIIEHEGEAQVTLAGREFTVRRSFLDDLAGQPQADRIAALSKPLLILHAPDDGTVEVDNARRIFDTAQHPKSFVALDGANHLLNRLEDARFAARMIASWGQRYLPVDDQVASETDLGGAVAEDGVVLVSERGTGSFTQVVSAGHHQFLMDEPASAGGDDEGPSPYDMLSAALGACTAMTVRMYAQRKGWSLDSVRVALVHDKVHTKDCADCETREGRIDRFARVIELNGELDAPQRERLLEIADMCPVHRTLHAEVDVLTQAGDL